MGDCSTHVGLRLYKTLGVIGVEPRRRGPIVGVEIRGEKGRYQQANVGGRGPKARYQQASEGGRGPKARCQQASGDGEGRRPDTIKPVGIGRAEGPIPSNQ